jgi:hypothetical protein
VPATAQFCDAFSNKSFFKTITQLKYRRSRVQTNSQWDPETKALDEGFVLVKLAGGLRESPGNIDIQHADETFVPKSY